MMNNYYSGGMVPGTSVHEEEIEKIINEVKSQGVFDEFRRDCISDVDTKPAYQNLRSRVETTVQKFLEKLKFDSTLNKNVVRENMRKHVIESGYYNPGLDRITDQIVNPKMMPVLYPKVEKIVCEHLNIPYVPSVNPTTSSTKSQPLFNGPGSTNAALSNHLPSLISGLPGTESLQIGSSGDEKKDSEQQKQNAEGDQIRQTQENGDIEKQEDKGEKDGHDKKKEKEVGGGELKPTQSDGSEEKNDVGDSGSVQDTEKNFGDENTNENRNGGDAVKDSGITDMEVSPNRVKTPTSSPLSGISDLASHGDSDSNPSRTASPKLSQPDDGSDSELYPPGTRCGGPRTPPMEPLTPPNRGPHTPGSIHDDNSQQSNRSLLDNEDQRKGRGPRTPGSVQDEHSQHSMMDNEDSRDSLGGTQHERTNTLSSDKPDLLNIRTENRPRRDKQKHHDGDDLERSDSKREDLDEREDGQVDEDEDEKKGKRESLIRCKLTAFDEFEKSINLSRLQNTSHDSSRRSSGESSFAEDSPRKLYGNNHSNDDGSHSESEKLTRIGKSATSDKKGTNSELEKRSNRNRRDSEDSGDKDGDSGDESNEKTLKNVKNEDAMKSGGKYLVSQSSEDQSQDSMAMEIDESTQSPSSGIDRTRDRASSDNEIAERNKSSAENKNRKDEGNEKGEKLENDAKEKMKKYKIPKRKDKGETPKEQTSLQENEDRQDGREKGNDKSRDSSRGTSTSSSQDRHSRDRDKSKQDRKSSHRDKYRDRHSSSSSRDKGSEGSKEKHSSRDKYSSREKYSQDENSRDKNSQDEKDSRDKNKQRSDRSKDKYRESGSKSSSSKKDVSSQQKIEDGDKSRSRQEESRKRDRGGGSSADRQDSQERSSSCRDYKEGRSKDSPPSSDDEEGKVRNKQGAPSPSRGTNTSTASSSSRREVKGNGSRSGGRKVDGGQERGE
ncbi:hypothetical protein WDU94_002289 [Cyamophila willieti]